MGNVVTQVQEAAAGQQPQWPDPSQVRRVRSILAARPPLVRAEDVLALRTLLARVAHGEAHIIQSGDCAEDPEECTTEHVWRKSAVLDLLAATLKMTVHTPVLRVGRIAGQFAKPRSKPTEQVDGLELPVYRGHMVNEPAADPESRRPDPLRILTGYMAAGDIVEQLGWRRSPAPHPEIEPRVWTSHEALLLDYELPMLRETVDGRHWLASTHWPWIGERTRQLDGAHVAMLSGVINPVACKVGPGMTQEEVVELCERLDPGREPGRLTLIARMGADTVADRLPSLVEAVRAAGHPVIWLCDPMHSNTVSAPSGHKTRLVETVEREVRHFRQAVAKAGGVAGGLHLETTPHAVTECVGEAAELDAVGERYTSFCDPRLTPEQAARVVAAWGE
ncbi:3-deoxy-7-phosphoheptulonate synthase [Streptomyces sp. NPDC007205]|uniref:3-deoxy-7-phosphoheptulonate synthase n=1 Tax=Streptomyces sp. NPDC007205 TaxID=3154316 RepID=UPI0033F0B562